jgi:hypothetical protein
VAIARRARWAQAGCREPAYTSTFVNHSQQSDFFTYEASAQFGREVGGGDANRGSSWKLQMASLFNQLGKDFDALAAGSAGVFVKLPKVKDAGVSTSPSLNDLKKTHKAPFSFRLALPGQRPDRAFVTIGCDLGPNAEAGKKAMAPWVKFFAAAESTFERIGLQWPQVVESILVTEPTEGFGTLKILGTDPDEQRWKAIKNSPSTTQLREALTSEIKNSKLKKIDGLLRSATSQGALQLQSTGLEPLWLPIGISYSNCDDDLISKSDCTLTISRDYESAITLVFQINFKKGFKDDRAQLIKSLQAIVAKSNIK